MDIISRSRWGARSPRSRSAVSWGARREFVVHYSLGPTSQTPRSIQDFHMDSNGWSDVGYNLLVDVDGRVYEGRGWLTVGAHATGHNTSGIGVCFIGRDGDATDAAKAAIRGLYDEACRRAGRTLAKRGHRDVGSTSCPGDELARWVHNGMPVHNQEDDMPEYVSVGADAQELPPGEWTTVRWDREYSDADHHHRTAGGPSIVEGPARYAATVNVRIEGLAPGTELQARVVERRDDSGEVDSHGPICEYIASEGATFVHYAVPADTVGGGCRVRFQVVQYGDAAARITSGSAKAFAWPT